MTERLLSVAALSLTLWAFGRKFSRGGGEKQEDFLY